MKNKIFCFTTQDLVLIALMAAFGLAVKPLVKTLTHLVSSAWGVPGGTLGGGLYMMWLALALALTRRPGSAALVGLIQSLAALMLGIGGHGALSLVTYTLPGVMIDLVSLFYKRYTKLDGQIIYCLLANLTGTWAVGLIIMKLPKAPLLIALSLSIVSGVIGGILAWAVYSQLHNYKLA